LVSFSIISGQEASRVSEINPAEVAARGPRVMPERFRKEITESSSAVSERSAEREGLPPGYRMRADAHYVDQLTSRTPDMGIRFVSVDEIDGGPPIDAESISPLTQSIAAHGVLQPLLVRRDDSRYRIIAGRKRLAAARVAGLNSVPCVVHHVDEAGAAALAQAENLHTPSLEHRTEGDDAFAPYSLLTRLTDNLTGIEAAASLLASYGLPTSRRVSVEMIRSDAWRASWLLKAAAIADGQPKGEGRLCLLGSLLQRIREGFQSESRLSGIDIQVIVPDWNVSAVVDEENLSAGVTGAVVATLGLLERVGSGAISLIASAGPGGAPSIDIAQDAARVSSETANRFFDPAWTDRPGGWPAVAGALTARTVAQQHGGDAVLLARDRRGSTIRLTLDQN
jgi:hypothetical protein